MRSPSSRILENAVNLYSATSTQDAVGGFVPAYPLIPTQADIPASVQYTGTEQQVEDQGRVTTVNVYTIFFGQTIPLKPKDLITWADGSVTRSLFVQTIPPSEAGRGGAFTARAIEKT